MAALSSEIGNRYGRLTVIARAPNKGTRAYWLCKCDCGVEKVVGGKHLRRGTTTSCGCYRKEVSAQKGRQKKLSEKEVRRRCLENGFELLSEYKGVLSKAKFRCTTCGLETVRKADSKIYGLWGCDRCSKRQYDFNRKIRIENNPDYANSKALVYLMTFQGEGETFYKVGFTTEGIKERIRKIPYAMIDVECVETTVKRAHELEREFKQIIEAYAYRPKINFAGCAECFQPAPLVNKLKVWTNDPFLFGTYQKH
jgi:hypothetical protein